MKSGAKRKKKCRKAGLKKKAKLLQIIDSFNPLPCGLFDGRGSWVLFPITSDRGSMFMFRGKAKVSSNDFLKKQVSSPLAQ